MEHSLKLATRELPEDNDIAKLEEELKNRGYEQEYIRSIQARIGKPGCIFFVEIRQTLGFQKIYETSELLYACSADQWLKAHEKHLEQSPPTEMEFCPVPPTPQYHIVPAKKPQQGPTLATPLFRSEINRKYPPFSRQYHPASNQYQSPVPTPQYSLVQHKYRPIQLPDVTKPPPMYTRPVAAVAPVQYVADQWLEAHEKHLEQSPPTEMEFYPVPPTPQYHLVPAKKPQQRSTLATPLFRPEINLKYPPFSRQYHPAPTQYHPAPNQYHRAPTQYQPVPTPYKSQLPTPQYSLVQHKYRPILLPDVTKPPPMYNIPVAAVAPVQYVADQWLKAHEKHLEQSPPIEMEFYPVPPTPQYHLVPAKKPQQDPTLASPMFRPEINLKYPPFSSQYYPAPTQYHPTSPQYQPVPTPYLSPVPTPQYSLVQHKYQPIQLHNVTKPPPMYTRPVAAVAPVQYVYTYLP
ncbi:uncharacterized protein LOC126371984 [Pectinophora gossypiella]|uniref:uncharacterized protein LOC126371984 n=1 Tax=Pectinophora gossypiella TaxID=13191 RepID=UPI00214EDA80|nr:uncharacterized protein LOC126371984 [Pectinophora gossypiella]